MRIPCVFFFLGYLLSTSHAQLDGFIYNSGNETGAINFPYEEVINIRDQLHKPALPSVPLAAPTLAQSVDMQGAVGELDFLAQEGLLGALILNSENLLKEREKLLEILLGRNIVFNGTDELLKVAGPLALEGLLCKGPLSGLCGHGSLIGMNDVLKNMNPGKFNNWLNITRFNIVQVSGRIFASSNNQLQLQTKLSINFPGLLNFLSNSILDININAPFELQQPNPGQLSFALKDCQPIFTGIQMRVGVLSKVVQSMLKWSLNISLPNILCPMVRFWFYIINQQLAILTDIYSPKVLEKGSMPVSPVSLPQEQNYSLDFKNKNFPASFINWLIKGQLV